MTIEQERQELKNMVATLTDEQCKRFIRAIELTKSLNDEKADEALKLLKDGMTLDELSEFIENGGLAV